MQERAEESRASRWVDDCITKQSAQLYHKFDNARGSDYAKARAMEQDARGSDA